MVHHFRTGKLRAASGFTYVFFLWFILIYGIFLGSYIEITSTQAKRQKEAEFFQVAITYQQAIEHYYRQKQIFPLTPQLLLCDGKNYPCTRYLRQLYLDPLTHQPFDYIYSVQHEIIGVRSRAKDTVLTQAKAKEYQAITYDQIEFIAQVQIAPVYP